MKRKIALFFVCMIMASAVSCDRVSYRTAYNNVEWLALYQIDKFFNLTMDQKIFIKNKIAAQHTWHSRKVLPGYADIIRSMQQQVRKGLTLQGQEQIQRRVGAEMEKLGQHIAPDCAELMMMISPDQVRYFRRQLDIYNEKEIKKKTERDENPKAKRLDHVFFLMDLWYGGFTAEEKIRITKITAKYPDPSNPALRIRYLKESQAGFLALLEKKRDKKKIEKYIAGWLGRGRSFVPAYYRDQLDYEARIDRAVFLEVDRTVVTERHRREGIAKLQELIVMIDDVKGK